MSGQPAAQRVIQRMDLAGIEQEIIPGFPVQVAVPGVPMAQPDRCHRNPLPAGWLAGAAKRATSDRCLEKTVSVKGDAIDLWYSGKAHHHGGNIQAISRPDELPLWVSPAEPGSVHDITAARIHALPALHRAAALGLPALADPGYQGAGIGIHIPVKQPDDGRELDPGNRTRNANQRSLRCPGERAFALLNQRWRTLQHITAGPSKITGVARAALVLTQYEHGYIN